MSTSVKDQQLLVQKIYKNLKNKQKSKVGKKDVKQSIRDKTKKKLNNTSNDNNDILTRFVNKILFTNKVFRIVHFFDFLKFPFFLSVVV